jgi:hypothetical protein
MAKESNDVPEFMRGLRKVRQELEKVMRDAIINFERASGLTIYDIELIRTMRPTIGGNDSTFTSVSAVRIDTRLD